MGRNKLRNKSKLQTKTKAGLKALYIGVLAAQAMSAGAIAENFDAARPTISKHIQILTDCDLVEANKQGREIYYQIKMDKMNEIDLWLEQLRTIWDTRFDNLEKYLEKIQQNKHE